jgi:hypothetical protein
VGTLEKEYGTLKKDDKKEKSMLSDMEAEIAKMMAG